MAFEMAQQLRSRGEEVERLFILDTALPADGSLDLDQDEIDRDVL